MKKGLLAAALITSLIGVAPNRGNDVHPSKNEDLYDFTKFVVLPDNETEEERINYEFIEREAECMAKNMYFEAAVEGESGWLSVTLVVLNRVAHPTYPNTVCEVVTQARHSKWWLEVRGKEVPLRNKCQFSWYCDGKPDNPRILKIYNEMLDLSRMILVGDVVIEDITQGALYYHADYVNPPWAKSMKQTTKIGRHIFYNAATN